MFIISNQFFDLIFILFVFHNVVDNSKTVVALFNYTIFNILALDIHYVLRISIFKSM